MLTFYLQTLLYIHLLVFWRSHAVFHEDSEITRAHFTFFFSSLYAFYFSCLSVLAKIIQYIIEWEWRWTSLSYFHIIREGDSIFLHHVTVQGFSQVFIIRLKNNFLFSICCLLKIFNQGYYINIDKCFWHHKNHEDIFLHTANEVLAPWDKPTWWWCITISVYVP